MKETDYEVVVIHISEIIFKKHQKKGMKMQKIVINKCYGGFGLSDKAYERMIELGIPVRAYKEKRRGKNGLVKPNPDNEGEIIFDDNLVKDSTNRVGCISGNRYWDAWTRNNRTHPVLVQVVEELKSKASGSLAKLKVVSIPDNVEWTIEEYDGVEWIAEKHETWG